VRQWSHAPLFSGSPLREAAKCCFYKTCGTAAKLMGPAIINHFFFLNQTVICVTTSEVLPNNKASLKMEVVWRSLPPNYFMVSDLCFFITKIYFDCHINLVHESPPNIHLHIFLKKKVIYSHDKFRIATEKHVNKQIYPNSQPTKTSLCSHSDFGWCAGDTSHNHQNDMFCSPR